mmetsp:Transcript_52159/g.124286  ORF Transcript_52159/g.124286 Transcript_52159/m.124286 type:complete len:227 (+) Transcript_52159:726-1406(+)
MGPTNLPERFAAAAHTTSGCKILCTASGSNFACVKAMMVVLNSASMPTGRRSGIGIRSPAAAPRKPKAPSRTQARRTASSCETTAAPAALAAGAACVGGAAAFCICCPFSPPAACMPVATDAATVWVADQPTPMKPTVFAQTSCLYGGSAAMDLSSDARGGAKNKPIHLPRKSTPGLSTSAILSANCLLFNFCVARKMAKRLSIAPRVEGIFVRPSLRRIAATTFS